MHICVYAHVYMLFTSIYICICIIIFWNIFRRLASHLDLLCGWSVSLVQLWHALRGPASSAGVGLSSLCGFLFVFVTCTCIIVVKAFF
jgi:hypothetical protein